MKSKLKLFSYFSFTMNNPRILVSAMAALMLLLLTPESEAAITCSDVLKDLRPCVNYLTNGTGKPPAACCAGAKALSSAVSSPADKKTACGCIKNAAQKMNPNAQLAQALPGNCGITLPINSDESPTGSNILTTSSTGTSEEVQSFNSVHDNPNLKITSQLLDGLNYGRWAQLVKLYVGGHRKIRFLLGTEKEHALTDAKHAKWFSNDSMKVYSQRENNARTFQFSSEIENFKHGTQSPGTYYGSFDWPEKELSLYDSFIDWLASAVGATTPLPSTTVEIYENTMEKNRVFQFLAGLNSEFEYARDAYASYPSGFQQFLPIKKCDRCGKWGYLKATCHALHDRPPGYQSPLSQPAANFSANFSVQESSASSSLSQDEINSPRSQAVSVANGATTPIAKGLYHDY
ncbi:hypothetical protein JRO89_XS05G0167500 [Xanthoceras sorbifolium]|uniref:Non-specific lipid-transfer protein n=1 Tax=Xanthoceras sorbifolium TaxID=99658 RepID=A0ABQ8I274_9ROSI|nr:hypothetical protein JRO89_XS05G0167500 [Xanthoceras sorbifolium]